ncbi:phage tail protein [Cedecea davisae]|uniref:phage tail-collar fiber domain-containing protein n=1 Tax=Cedecea davisae TaxID=158484 RepID=UPI002430FECE|nr:phage tail protein [Cedecea davisae]
MSQAVITKAFAEWKARQAIDNQPVVLDEFIFAFVPGQDATKPIDNTEGVPVDNIVDRMPVSKSGVVNADSVVYSVTMGADVGDYDFNWIGLANKATGTLAMIIHAPTQSKVKNANGQQGNVLVRSMLMEFSGAQEATAITTPAETWQIDFTARLAAMDERQRVENTDIFGAGAFFGDGWLVVRNGNQYSAQPGAGYVGGLRAELAATQPITVGLKPVKIWLDVCWKGTLTSVWGVEHKLVSAETLQDYQAEGVQHYVFALASIDASGVVTDLRPKGTLGEQQGNSDFVRKDKNLADLKDKPEARKALGLKSAAQIDAQMSRDDATPGKAVLTGNALAVRGTRAAGELAAADVLDANDLPTNAVSFTYSSAKNAPGFSASVLSYSGLSGGYDVQLAASYDTPGLVRLRTQNGDVKKWSKWTTFYTTENKPTSADVGAVPAAGGSVGYLENSDHYGTKDGAWPGVGMFQDQLKDRRALFYSAGYTADGNVFLPMTKATVQTKGLGYIASISYGALTSGGSNFPSACLHILSDHGNGTYKDSTWIFNPNDGKFSSPGDVVSGKNVIADGAVYESGGGVRVYSPNNPQPIDTSWLAETKWVMDNFATKSTASLALNGWHRDASTGLITQWGFTNNASGLQTIYFPIAFPNVCFIIQSTPYTAGVIGTVTSVVMSLNNSSATFNTSQPIPVFWEAKGY